MNIACFLPDDNTFHAVQAALSRCGFIYERFVTDAALLRSLRRRDFDFIVIDIGKDAHGAEGIFSWLGCRSGERAPVLVIAGTRDAELAAAALNAGADDFMVTPVEQVELIARVHAVLRRCSRRQVRRTIELAGFTLERDAALAAFRGAPVELTPREFTVAWLLFSSPGEYVSRETMSIAIWGTDSDVAGRTIEQHVYKLRKKLGLGPERGLIIRTAYNRGYRLELWGGIEPAAE